MIYICRIDTGTRHIFDLADGIENVGSLTNAIESQFKIDKGKQILLISGGEVLDDYQRKFYGFGFGCEESPIYLIDKSNVEKPQPPVVELPLDFLYQDMKQELQTAMSLRPSFQTLQTRSQLIYKINELDKNILKVCKSYYDDQYWQYQGFLTLIANLDEFASSFRKKLEVIHDQFEKFFKNEVGYKELMKEIDKHIELLSHVRLVPSLLKNDSNESGNLSGNSNADDDSKLNQTGTNGRLTTATAIARTNLFSCFSSQSIPNLQSTQFISTKCVPSSNHNESSGPSSPTAGPLKLDDRQLTLLDWIKSTDPNNKLNSVIEETNEILANFDKNPKWADLYGKIRKLLGQVENNAQMKEIEGLAKRLEDLKGFLTQAEKFLANQNEINESLKSNYERASNLRDETVLNDLCKGHERQLDIFRTNHLNLIEIANKISRAKLELIRVVHSRLNWIMQVQKQIAEYDFQIQISFKQLKRLNVRMKLMEQIKRAPHVYLYAIKETVRRLQFSKAYKTFASLVTDLIKKLYESEMKKRQAYETTTNTLSSSQHFILNILFRSLNDKVELFLNENALRFDDSLPVISDQEVKSIEDELNEHLKLINLKSSGELINDPASSSSGEDSQSSVKMLKISSSSSTVSVSQSVSSPSALSPVFYLANNPSTKLDLVNNENLLLLNKLISLMENYHQNQQQQQSSSTTSPSENVVNANQSRPKSPSQESKLLAEVLKEIKLKLNETKAYINDSKSEINELLTTKFEEFTTKKNSLNGSNYNKKILDAVEGESTTESLSDEDKELVRKLTDHVNRIKSDYDQKLAELRQGMEIMKKNLNAEKQIQFNEAIKRVTSEKDRQIEELKAKQNELMSRIGSLEKRLEGDSTRRSTIVSLNNESFSSSAALAAGTENSELQIINGDDLNETKWRLRELMLKEKINQLEKQLSNLTTLPVTNNFYETIQLNSCNVDDLVLAVYSEEHNSYKIIYKTSNYLHFVHSAIFKNGEQKLSVKTSTPSFRGVPISASSTQIVAAGSPLVGVENSQSDVSDQAASSLVSTARSNDSDGNLDLKNSANLSVVDCSDNMFLGDKQPAWFVGKVLVKEFCVARKENNRFKVPSGTRFYRVKLKPYTL